MAAGLGYIEFATGDILTAAVANGYLASQTVMVFADAAARTSAIASPQEGMISYLKDTNAVQYYSGSAWVAVGGGGGGGKVLQVVNATYTTATTISTTTYADSGLTASITPSASTSKVLVLITQPVLMQRSTSQANAGIKLVRNSTTIADWAPSGYESFGITALGSTTDALRSIVTMSWLDSPATTSSTTYKTQGRTESNNNSPLLQFQESGAPASIILMEIGA